MIPLSVSVVRTSLWYNENHFLGPTRPCLTGLAGGYLQNCHYGRPGAALSAPPPGAARKYNKRHTLEGCAGCVLRPLSVVNTNPGRRSLCTRNLPLPPLTHPSTLDPLPSLPTLAPDAYPSLGGCVTKDSLTLLRNGSARSLHTHCEN